MSTGWHCLLTVDGEETEIHDFDERELITWLIKLRKQNIRFEANCYSDGGIGDTGGGYSFFPSFWRYSFDDEGNLLVIGSDTPQSHGGYVIRRIDSYELVSYK